ncbi:hypothetical protein D3C81_1752040 [compost metagenome]
MDYLRHTDGYVAFGVKNPRHLFVRMGHVLQHLGYFILHLHVSFAQTPCYSICGSSPGGAENPAGPAAERRGFREELEEI